MADLRLSRLAERDLEDVRDWGIEQFGPYASIRHLEGFESLFTLLREYPEAGESKPRWGRAIPSMSHRPHRVLYRLTGGTVLIVRILHNSRNVRQALRSRR